MTNSTPEKIEFYKMSGSGNDFIVIDNMDLSLSVGDLSSFARKICQRKISVGADGLVLIEPSARADFRWRFYNSDGSLAEMCGNAARCVARLAHLKGIAGTKLSFETMAGIIHAEIENDVPKVKLTDPSTVSVDQKIVIDGREFALDIVDTGVPHAVNFVPDVASLDVFSWGRKIRYHERFQPKGTNVNYAAVLDRRTLKVRTYERGVENETFACGTGAVAAVLAAAQRNLVDSPADALVQSGDTLRIYFTRQKESFREIYLEGRVKIVYQGYLFEEAYK
ncbi:MAG TPA: diaminopimelate epimerase [Smithellaceae bacterium]|nr:diaminopimelate epimerase [Smithellaceae bacterium]HRS89655.1 diaminopimelate epimerase [Smithellaceae bacterium]HRV25208.1 diaminopimelate epimerase [Smithellaceae bacterium]